MAEEGGNVIDKLEIEIQTTAKGASAILASVESDLKRLKSILGSINVEELTKVQQAAKTINKTTTNPKVNTNDVTKAERNVITSVNKIKQSLAGLQPIYENAMSGDSSAITSFYRRVMSIQSAISTVEEKFRQLQGVTMESSPFGRLKVEETELEARLATLKQKLADATSGNSNVSNTTMQQYQQDIETTKTRLQEVRSEQEALKNSGQAVEVPSLQNYRDTIIEVSQALNQLKANMDNANSSPLDGSSANSASTLEKALSALTSQSDRATSSLKSLFGSAVKGSFSALTSAITGVKERLSSMTKDTTKSFNKGFKTILRYGFGIRSLYVLFRRLKEAIKDSFTELQKSGAEYQTTKANIEALKNSLTTLKYQFGAAFEPIFNTVAPALQTLVNYLVTVMNTISAFIAKLTGRSTYSKAVVSTEEIAENTGSAAGSAEELNKQLQGFDELNNLSGDNGSGGGGGGSSSSDDSNVTYEEASVESALSDFMSSIADDIENGDWFSVGSKISDKLTGALNSINWDSIFATASNFGTNLASFLNGLISPELFGSLGATIANAIKTKLTFLNTFGTTFEWSEFGQSIATGINNFVEKNPLSLAVDTFNSWANGILDTLITALQGVSWSEIRDQITEALEKIKVGDITEKLGTLVSTIAEALNTLVSDKETWSELGTKIAEGINGFFEGFKGEDVGNLLSNLVHGLEDMVITALKKIEWSKVGEDLVDLIGNMPIGDIFLAIGAVKLGTGVYALLSSAIKTLLSTKVMAIVGSMGSVSAGTVGISVIASLTIGWKIGNSIYESATGHEVEEGMIAQLKDIWKGFTEDEIEFNLLDFIDFTVNDANGWYGTWRDWVYDFQTYATADLTTLGNKIWEGIKNGFKTALSWAEMFGEFWNDANDALFEPIFELGEDIWDGIKEGFQDAIDWASPIKDFFDKCVEKIKSVFGINSPAENVKYLGGYIYDGIIEGFKNKFTDIKEFVQEFYNKFIAKVKEIFGDFSLGSIVGSIGDVAMNIKTTFEGAVESVAEFTGLDDTLNNIKTGYKSMKAKLTSTMSGIANSPDKLKEVKQAFVELKEAWCDKAATLKAKVGEQISRITDLDTWKSKMRSLRNEWSDKTAELKAKVGEQIEKITDLDTWGEKFANVSAKWKSPAEAVFSAKTGGSIKNINDLSGTDGNGGWAKRITDLYNKWKGRTATFDTKANVDKVTNTQSSLTAQRNAWKGNTATFNTSADVSNVSNAMKQGGALTKAKESWNSTTATATFHTSTDLSNAQRAIEKDGTLYNLYYAWQTWGAEAKFTATFDSDSSGSNEFINSFATKLATTIESKLSGMNIKVNSSGKIYVSLGGAAEGGIISHGKLKSIPQYANGTLNAGSLFVAGEAGPELMGNINGRTEILNKSQIASTMNRAIISGMMKFKNLELISPEKLEPSATINSTYNTNAFSKDYQDALNEQNRLLAEQNGYLRQIAEKDTSISARDVFNATRGEANNYYRRTGTSPFLF